MSEEGKEKQGFKVTDRRSFTPEGDRREKPESAAEEPSGGGPPGAGSDAPPRPERPPDPGADPGRQRPEIDFSSFILSLATTAMVHLGEVPEPGGQTRQNLDAAKQMVDILAILEKKTEGNRTPEESQLLDEILYELRMKFLSKSKTIQL